MSHQRMGLEQQYFNDTTCQAHDISEHTLTSPHDGHKLRNLPWEMVLPFYRLALLQILF